MFYHLIPLAEIKRSATTYWRPGRDIPASDDAWVLLLELESGCAATIVDIPAGADGRRRAGACGCRCVRRRAADPGDDPVLNDDELTLHYSDVDGVLGRAVLVCLTGVPLAFSLLLLVFAVAHTRDPRLALIGADQR